MTRFSFVFLVACLFGLPAFAVTENTGLFEDLEFVGETTVATPGQAQIALCHTTDDVRLLGFTLFSNITGYALATESCTGELVQRLTADDIRSAQAAGTIDPAIPVIAKNDVRRNLTNYGVWIAVIMGLVAVIIRRVKALLGYDLRGPLRRKTTQQIISAMCHAGQRDGIIDSREIALIRRTAQRLTRRAIRPSEIVKAADKAKDNLTENDYINFGRGLRDGEKDILMRAVFYVTLASGRLYPAEHEFLTGLAYGIGMPGEDFRRVMNDALGDLDLYPPR
jgi:hypothetical protein